MSYSISLSGLGNASTELNVISNNLANAQTNGFKYATVNFADIVAGTAFTNPKMIQGIGSFTQSIQQNFSNGSVVATSSATDLTIDGNGFFTVTNPATAQTYYTRNGNFTVDGGGYLVDAYGNRMQVLPVDAANNVTSTTTPVDCQLPADDGALPPATPSPLAGVAINTDGSVMASFDNGTSRSVGRVALATFTTDTGLLQTGNQDWQATGLSGLPTYGIPNDGAYGKLLSGELEQSNVDVAAQMVQLISAQQYFQANAKAIDTQTAVSQAVINLRN